MDVTKQTNWPEENVTFIAKEINFKSNDAERLDALDDLRAMGIGRVCNGQ